ncbi:MAG: hypothetical protein AAB551_03025 [Patescibacteria group bacterium]
MTLYFDGGPESLGPSDNEGSGSKVSEQAHEQFREQMRATTQKLKNMQKGEQKKKKKEDRLAKILSDFLKKQTKSHLVLLAAKLLAEGIPALFVLSMMIITDPESLADSRKTLDEEGRRLDPLSWTDEEIAIFPEVNGDMIDWMNIVAEYAGRDAMKFLGTVRNSEKKLKYIVLDFASAVLKDYFGDKNMELETENAQKLSVQILKKVIESVQRNAEQLENIRDMQDMGGPVEGHL